MRRLLKFIFGLSMAAAMGMSLAACGGGKNEKSEKGGNSNTEVTKIDVDVKEVVFSEEKIDMKDVKGATNTYTITDDKVFFVTTDAYDDEGFDESSEDVSQDVESEDYGNYVSIARLYSMSHEGTDLKELCELQFEDCKEYIQNIIVDKHNNVVILSAIADAKTESQQYYVSVADENGKISEHNNLSEAMDLSKDTYIDTMLTDSEGNYIFVTGQSVLLADNSLNKIGEVKDDNNYIACVTGTPDGRILCGVQCSEGTFVKELSVKDKEFVETYEIDVPYFDGNDSMLNGYGDYDFLFRNAEGLYGYKLKDKTSTEVFDFMASGVSGNSIYNITTVDSDHFLCMSYEDTDSDLVLYKKVDKSQVKDKVIITFGSMLGVDDGIRNAATKFNKESDKYRIEFTDYADTEDYVEAQTRMNADFVAGKVPDIIDLNYFNIEDYAKKGLLEDLTPYFEKDDEVQKEDILPSVEKAMEIDGKLYYVAPHFNIQSIIASKKDVGDKSGWTFKELAELLEKKGKDVSPFYYDNKVNIMYSFLGFCTDDYIDWNTGKCRFDSDDFKSVLEIANRGKTEDMDYSEDYPSQDEMLKDGKVLLVDGDIYTDSIQVYKTIYGSDITFIGYPCEDKCGSYFNFNCRMGIYSKSEVKEGAWEFLRYIMTKEYQIGDGLLYSNPTNKEAFEMFMKTKTTTKPYVDDFGNEIEPLNESWESDCGMVEIGPLAPDEEKRYRDLIDNTTKITRPNVAIMDIINEEAENYFHGRKKLDEVVEIIQNRVTTYVNENR